MRATWGLMLALVVGCPGGEDTGKTDDTSDDSGDDSGHDTGDGCGEDGICDVIVSEVAGECGEDMGGVATLGATAEGPGQVRVKLVDAVTGCCPTVTAEAFVSQRTGEISFSYAIEGDDCDCVCMIDVSFLVSDVPAGNWNVVWDVASVSVMVE